MSLGTSPPRGNGTDGTSRFDLESRVATSAGSNWAGWRRLLLALVGLALCADPGAAWCCNGGTDPNFSHGFFVPAFAGFCALAGPCAAGGDPPGPRIWGLAVILISLCTLILGVFGAELFLSPDVVADAGHRIGPLLPGMGILARSPVPAAVSGADGPHPGDRFQSDHFSPADSGVEVVGLRRFPILACPVFREGNVINLPAMPLEVAEACSGIRSLLSLTTLAIMYGYLMEKRMCRSEWCWRWPPSRSRWPQMRCALWGPDFWSSTGTPTRRKGSFHAFSGWLIFVVSLLMLFVLHRALNLVRRSARGAGMRVTMAFLGGGGLARGHGIAAARAQRAEVIPAAPPSSDFSACSGNLELR